MTKTEVTDLYDAILSLGSVPECVRFFADLCTPAETKSLSDRWLVARLLTEGVPYRAISLRTGVSTATVTRVARALTYGAQGYRIALERRPKPRIRKPTVDRSKPDA